MEARYKRLADQLERKRLSFKMFPSKELESEIRELDAELKRIYKDVGTWTTPVGNYKNAMELTKY